MIIFYGSVFLVGFEILWLICRLGFPFLVGRGGALSWWGSLMILCFLLQSRPINLLAFLVSGVVPSRWRRLLSPRPSELRVVAMKGRLLQLVHILLSRQHCSAKQWRRSWRLAQWSLLSRVSIASFFPELLFVVEYFGCILGGWGVGQWYS